MGFLRPLTDRAYGLALDNGKKFPHREVIAQDLEGDLYFAHRNTSVANTHGLVFFINGINKSGL